MLATYALLPVLRRFAAFANVEITLEDISVAARVLAQFPDALAAPVPDALAELGALAKRPEANIVKLPNISVRRIPLFVSLRQHRPAPGGGL